MLARGSFYDDQRCAAFDCVSCFDLDFPDRTPIGLCTSFSIFIASTMTSPCPFSTTSPSETKTAMTFPGIGTETR